MIIIAPYAQKLRNGKENPKNYAYWEELVQELQKTMHVVQVGIEGEEQLVDDFRKNRHIPELRALLKDCTTWIGVDSFFQHLAWDECVPGIVLWGPSDPLIFGHKENTNLLKDRSYLVENQFLWWENTEHRADRFVKPKEVLQYLYKD
jgi:ADP-heptose:LPS heptosyltransferase